MEVFLILITKLDNSGARITLGEEKNNKAK